MGGGGGVSIVYTGKVKYSNVSNLSIIIYDENGWSLIAALLINFS